MKNSSLSDQVKWGKAANLLNWVAAEFEILTFIMACIISMSAKKKRVKGEHVKWRS
jgi:hypothetical protein